VSVAFNSYTGTATAGQTLFDVSADITTVLFVSLNGAMFYPGINYTASVGQVTLLTAASAGDQLLAFGFAAETIPSGPGTPMFSSYADFRTKFQQMFDGDDISQSDISVTVLDLIIALGERRLYRELRSSTLDTSFTLTTTNNLAPLPSDYLELRGAPYVAKKVSATYAPWEEVNNAIQIQSNSIISSNPVRYTFQGDNLLFFPIQADGTVVTGQYYKQFPNIATGLNAFFTRHGDLFLYAALAESGPFIGDDRTPVWEAKFSNLVQAANEEERRRITRGSKLQTRVA
jgi:hypothetical protein